jgi:hypothetical protein
MSVSSPSVALDFSPQIRWGQAYDDPEGGQIEFELGIGEVWRARGDQRWRIIVCRRGVVWITQERDLADYVLRTGEAFIVTLPGPVLVQALEPASVAVTSCIRATPYSGDYRPFP